MKDYIVERVLQVGRYVADKKCTVRDVAKVFCISKSTAHKDLSERLPVLDKNLFAEVSSVLGENWEERYIRGGLATREKYCRIRESARKRDVFQ